MILLFVGSLLCAWAGWIAGEYDWKVGAAVLLGIIGSALVQAGLQ